MLWGEVARGSVRYSGDGNVARGRQMLLGGEVARGKLLGGDETARGRQMLLGGRQCYSGESNVARREWNLKCVKYIKTRRNS
ncbi:MAG TPA: hypothetical protein P5543_05880 [Planctomycetota bacterium]|nr:hypothetical protein [Planctomycetota bacterium]